MTLSFLQFQSEASVQGKATESWSSVGGCTAEQSVCVCLCVYMCGEVLFLLKGFAVYWEKTFPSLFPPILSVLKSVLK